jgi:TonB family protein
VPLDAGQIASGSVVYRKPSQDVSFELRLKTSEGTRVTQDARLSDISLPALPKEFGSDAAALPNSNGDSGVPLSASANLPLPLQPLLSNPVPASEQASETKDDQSDSQTFYLPARPSKQVLPNRHLLAGDSLNEVSDVAIEVGVDSRGRVTDARLLRSDPPASADVIAISIDAAKQWRFQPAMFHGRAVAAHERIVFQFRQHKRNEP